MECDLPTHTLTCVLPVAAVLVKVEEYLEGRHPLAGPAGRAEHLGVGVPGVGALLPVLLPVGGLQRVAGGRAVPQHRLRHRRAQPRHRHQPRPAHPQLQLQLVRHPGNLLVRGACTLLTQFCSGWNIGADKRFSDQWTINVRIWNHWYIV